MISVRSQYFYAPQIALDVPACLFTPQPKVDSAFVVMPRRPQKPVDAEDEGVFFRVAAAAFAMRRKTMGRQERKSCAFFRVCRAFTCRRFTSISITTRGNWT